MEKRYFGEQDYCFELEAHSVLVLRTLDVQEI
jgi:hypothetical protein